LFNKNKNIYNKSGYSRGHENFPIRHVYVLKIHRFRHV